MDIVDTLVFILMLIFDYIELSSQFECLPNGEPILGVHRGESSYSSERQLSSGRPLSPVKQDANSTSQSKKSESVTDKPESLDDKSKRLCVRSGSPLCRFMNPPTMIDFFFGCQYELDPIEWIRISPRKNPHRVFELRRYTFPPDINIRLLAARGSYCRMPNQEQIALSTADGDVFAIMETSNIFAGLYSSNWHNAGYLRAKINMGSGKITFLTKTETADVMIGHRTKISMSYKVERIEPNSLHH